MFSQRRIVLSSFVGLAALAALGVLAIHKAGVGRFDAGQVGLLAGRDIQEPDVLARLEVTIAKDPPNTVLRADKSGSVKERFVVDTNESSLYSSFAQFLAQRRDETGCKKSSKHCVTCPNGQIYCTNVSPFLLLPPSE